MRSTRRVTAPLLRFGRRLRYLASSLASTGLDYAALLALNAVLDSVLLPLVLARTASCTMNYLLNRKVFGADGRVLATGAKYAAWEATIMLAVYLAIQGLIAAGLALWIASILANSSLFALNYTGQRLLVFGSPADLRALVSPIAEGGARLLAKAGLPERSALLLARA